MMKNMKLFAPLLAVLLLCVGVQVARADLDAVLTSGVRYGTEQKTSTVDQSVTVDFSGRSAQFNRLILRAWLDVTDANNTAVVTMTKADGQTLSMFSLPQVDATNEATVDFRGQWIVNDGTAASITNVFPVLLEYGDTLKFSDSLTNSITIYRIEYVDIPK